MRFQLEPVTLAFFHEALPLFLSHHREIPEFGEQKLDIDYETYLRIQEAGALRLFTAREETGKLIGYQVFSISRHLHYNAKVASQMALFIPPERRGFGISFMRWCNRVLATDGVDTVLQHVTKHCDFSKILKRDGFEFMDAVYRKKLKEAS